jgi:hypothetical protein
MWVLGSESFLSGKPYESRESTNVGGTSEWPDEVSRLPCTTNISACFWLQSNVEFPGLEQILERAAMPNRTVILTTLNQAWAQPNTMIHLFLESFRSGEGIAHYLNHLVIVALDQVAYERCRELHTLCYMLKTEGVDFAEEKFFMTEDYLRMMWRRIYFLKYILQMGYSFVFSVMYFSIVLRFLLHN